MEGREGEREGGRTYLGVLVVGVLPRLGQEAVVPKDRAVVVTGARREGGKEGGRKGGRERGREEGRKGRHS